MYNDMTGLKNEQNSFSTSTHPLKNPLLLYPLHCPPVVQPYLEHFAYFLHTHRNSYCLILYFVLILAQNFT